MKRDRNILFIVLLVVFFLQIYIFNIKSGSYYQNGFAIGISCEDKGLGIGITLMYVLVPVLFILFFTSGSVYNMLHGYEKLLVIRNYSKTRLMLQKILKSAVTVLLMVGVQCLVFLPFNFLFTPVKHGMAASLLMYFIMLLAIIMLQHLLEFYFPAQVVNLCLFMYCFLSYYVVQTSVKKEEIWFKILFWPSLLFGMQNGAVANTPDYGIYLTAGIFLNLLLMVLCIRKFKKADIF